MNNCDQHGLPNNEFGFCSECEKDENIKIEKCNKCGKPYAVHSNATSNRMCPSCLIALMM